MVAAQADPPEVQILFVVVVDQTTLAQADRRRLAAAYLEQVVDPLERAKALPEVAPLVQPLRQRLRLLAATKHARRHNWGRRQGPAAT